MRPLSFVSRCSPNYQWDRAEIFHSPWGILCATLGKKLTRSCQVTELWRHKGNKVGPFLGELVDYCTLEGDIDHDEPSLDHFRSELTCLTPPQCLLTFWSRAWVSSRSGQWPSLTFEHMYTQVGHSQTLQCKSIKWLSFNSFHRELSESL